MNRSDPQFIKSRKSHYPHPLCMCVWQPQAPTYPTLLLAIKKRSPITHIKPNPMKEDMNPIASRRSSSLSQAQVVRVRKKKRDLIKNMDRKQQA